MKTFFKLISNETKQHLGDTGKRLESLSATKKCALIGRGSVPDKKTIIVDVVVVT
jgi:hypothetical protein